MTRAMYREVSVSWISGEILKLSEVLSAHLSAASSKGDNVASGEVAGEGSEVCKFESGSSSGRSDLDETLEVIGGMCAIALSELIAGCFLYHKYF